MCFEASGEIALGLLVVVVSIVRDAAILRAVGKCDRSQVCQVQVLEEQNEVVQDRFLK